MLKKWKEFLNEGYLYIDNSLIEVLSSMKSSLAERIRELHDKDIKDILYNFLKYDGDDHFVDFFINKNLSKVEISIKGDTINYIRPNPYKDNRKNELLARTSPNTEDHNVNKIYRKGDKFKIKDYIVVDYNSHYLDNDRVLVLDNPSDSLISTVNLSNCEILWKGSKLSIGKVVRDLLIKSNTPFTDSELEEFVNEFKSKSEYFKDVEKRFEIVKGEDIKYYYNPENNERDTKSTLQSSCMADEDCIPFLDIYTDNKRIVSMLILRSISNTNKIVARALVWNTENGRKFMDRIYYSADYQVNLFIDYAKERGWIYRMVQSNRDKTLIDSKTDSEYSGNLYVNLDYFEYDYYPYLDTLKYLNVNRGILSNDRDFGHWELTETDGSYTTYRDDDDDIYY